MSIRPCMNIRLIFIIVTSFIFDVDQRLYHHANIFIHSAHSATQQHYLTIPNTELQHPTMLLTAA